MGKPSVCVCDVVTLSLRSSSQVMVDGKNVSVCLCDVVTLSS